MKDSRPLGKIRWTHSQSCPSNRSAGAVGRSAPAGALALVVALRAVKENTFWISLGTFSFLSLSLITAGRAGFGEEIFAQAILSRYASFSIPGVVVLHGLLANPAFDARSRIAAGLLGVLMVAMLAGAVRSYPRGMEASREDSRTRAARILTYYKTEPLAAFTIFGHEPARVRTFVPFPDRRNYGIFSEAEIQRTASERTASAQSSQN